MVRLLLLLAIRHSLLATYFQSHNGAIAALAGHRNLLSVLQSFNPTMVRLLPCGQ